MRTLHRAIGGCGHQFVDGLDGHGTVGFMTRDDVVAWIVKQRGYEYRACERCFPAPSVVHCTPDGNEIAVGARFPCGALKDSWDGGSMGKNYQGARDLEDAWFARYGGIRCPNCYPPNTIPQATALPVSETALPPKRVETLVRPKKLDVPCCAYDGEPLSPGRYGGCPFHGTVDKVILQTTAQFNAEHQTKGDRK